MPNNSLTQASPEWRTSQAPVVYADAMAQMDARAAAIAAGTAGELVWLLEHAPVYTLGLSARPEDLLDPGGIAVVRTPRGGQMTYHGPGQRIVYPVLDLKARQLDVRCYVDRLEGWMMAALARLGVAAGKRDGRVGLWVARQDGLDDKIAAIGIRVRHGVTLHGAAINVDVDLAPFAGIVPCGIRGHGVTSLRHLGCAATLADVDTALHQSFQDYFSEKPACLT